MSSGISGNYEGEGPNVAGGAGAQQPVAIPPDVAARGYGDATKAAAALQNGQGKDSMVSVDRRSRLRVSSEGARSGTAINVGAADQVLTVYARGFYVSGNGNIVMRGPDDTADQTYTGVVAGQYYPFCVALIRKTGTTATGNLLF
jgi:hypothetical protein